MVVHRWWLGLFLFIGCVIAAAAADVRRDLAYGADANQRMDVYLPAEPRHAPVIVMVHGGAWMIGDKANAGVVEPKATHWTKAGYVFVSLDYRLWPKAGPLEQANDVADALAYVEKHAASWGGRPIQGGVDGAFGRCASGRLAIVVAVHGHRTRGHALARYGIAG
jgi:arylformamidase